MKTYSTIPLLAAIASAQKAHDNEYYLRRCASGQPAFDRVVTGWGAGWSACSTTCGQGTATRDRTVIHEACNGGYELPLHQVRECMTQVCTCTKVLCKYESHTCTHYADAVGHQYHSAAALWANVAQTHRSIANVASSVDVTASVGSNQHDGFLSGFDNFAHKADTGLSAFGVGTQHGVELTKDDHDFSGACATSESVRVYHMNEDASAGHHCKHTKGGLCKCKCNRLFKDTYNPRTADLYDHTIDPALTPVDAVTAAPTSFPTLAPTAPVFAVGGKTTGDLGPNADLYTEFNLASFNPDSSTTFRLRCWDPIDGSVEHTMYLKGLADPSKAFAAHWIQDLSGVSCSMDADFTVAKTGSDCMYWAEEGGHPVWMLNSQHTYWGNSDFGFMFALYGGPYTPNTLRHCGLTASGVISSGPARDILAEISVMQ
jgi:hypothetical protein